MAEVVKAKERKTIELETGSEERQGKKQNKTNNNKNKEDNEKRGLFGGIILFCKGVKSEALKVRWTSKDEIFKYSVATIVFIVFFSIFFYGIDAIFAFVQSLLK